MQFVCNWQIDAQDFEPTMQAFTTSDPAAEFPENVTLVGRWHCGASRSGVAVIESDSAMAVMRLAMKWNHLIDMTIEPCVEDADAGQLCSEVLASRQQS